MKLEGRRSVYLTTEIYDPGVQILRRQNVQTGLIELGDSTGGAAEKVKRPELGNSH